MIGSQRHSWRVPACTAMLAVKAACSEASEHSGPRRPRQLDEDRDVSVDGFLSSLYVNLILFASFLFLVSILRRFFPEFYQPRSYVPEDFGAIERRELPGKSKYVSVYSIPVGLLSYILRYSSSLMYLFV